ncbi:MAG: hypothetical protein HY689_02175 [Chloroflexi bacterium]|nr:hypothetical protein [Chloroflexota bacterium]
MSATKEAYADTQEALTAFLRQHPAVERDAISERFERAYFLFQAGAVGPLEPEDGSRHVKAEGALGRAKPGTFASYRVHLAGRTCDCADLVYRLGRTQYQGWCKHLLAVWIYTYVAARPLPDAGALRTALEHACAWLENLQARVGLEAFHGTKPQGVASINDFYRILDYPADHTPAA